MIHQSSNLCFNHVPKTEVEWSIRCCLYDVDTLPLSSSSSYENQMEEYDDGEEEEEGAENT